MLRLAVIAVSLVLAGGVAAHAQAPSPPLQNKPDPRFLVFRHDCAEALYDLVQLQKRIKAAGWVKVDPASYAELKPILNSARFQYSRPSASFDFYSRTLGGSRLIMFIRGDLPSFEGQRTNECRVYDFGDTAFALDPDADGAMERWVGEPPSEVVSRPGDAAFKIWASTRDLPDVATVSVNNVHPNTPLTWQFKGRMWSATADVRR